MSIVRSFFSKNTSIVSTNYFNSSHNPVTEISYGTLEQQLSRFLFDIDLGYLRQLIDSGVINPENIDRHYLRMYNTVGNGRKYVGRTSYSDDIERAVSFNLDIFNIGEDWDEGNDYDFRYDVMLDELKSKPSNWYYKRTNEEWNVHGVYNSGATNIITSQRFDRGNENIYLDITEYINQRLFNSGNTDSFGLGVKFSSELESLQTERRQAVAFHTKYTNTIFEPHLETIINDLITDDRYYFYLDKENSLYLYLNNVDISDSIIVNHVDIYDYNNNLINTITNDDVFFVKKGVYRIKYKVDSLVYPDSVMFYDVWNITINNKTIEIRNDFYLIDSAIQYSINNTDQINLDNYYISIFGISERERIKRGIDRKIKINVRECYANQSKHIPLDIKYRLYVLVGGSYELDIIPLSKVDRTNMGYEFNISTSWLIPQDYKLQIVLSDGSYSSVKQDISFTIISDDIF